MGNSYGVKARQGGDRKDDEKYEKNVKIKYGGVKDAKREEKQR